LRFCIVSPRNRFSNQPLGARDAPTEVRRLGFNAPIGAPHFTPLSSPALPPIVSSAPLFSAAVDIWQRRKRSLDGRFLLFQLGNDAV
jgi:hypothetical protein